MSKFVTYPAVTVLDDDQSLLIDSPSAGTNSITAENAGNTLLSKWAGFETFDEAVQNTISNNQEFIDRDTAIRSETADLKRKIVTTFPAKDASGQIATFESEFEDAPLKSCIVQVNPVQDLHGYDSPWPAGGGVNTLDPESLIEQYPSPAYGLSIARSGEWLTINGTYSSEIQTPQFRFMKKKDDSIFNDTYWAFPDSNSSNNIPGWISKADSNKTLTIGLQNMIQGNTYNLRFRLMGVTDTTRPTDYAPYENICPISGWTGCEVQRTGVNLLPCPFDTASGTSFGGLTVTYTDNGVITVKGTKTASGTYTLKTMKLPAGTYTVYTNAELPSGMSLRVYHAATNTTYVSARTMSVTFTLTDELELIVYILTQNNLTGNVDITFRPQIELGSTATEYEPYSGNTYPIAFPPEARIVYGAYVDVINGELVVEYVRKRVNSDLGSVNFSTSRVLYTVSDAMPMNSETSISDANIMCSHFRKVSASTIAGCRYSYGNNYETAFILFQGLDTFGIENTLEGWNAFLESHEVYVTYKLAEPIHYPLAPTEIKTLLGTNNVWANTGDTAVEYLMSDVGWYVEKKLRAFQSILAGVEDSAVASKNYSTNSYLIFNDDIYRVTKTITAGETIEDGVNVTKTTVAEQLMALAQV